jgi:hypothetical protein
MEDEQLVVLFEVVSAMSGRNEVLKSASVPDPGSVGQYRHDPRPATNPPDLYVLSGGPAATSVVDGLLGDPELASFELDPNLLVYNIS